MEAEALVGLDEWCLALAGVGLRQERRALRLGLTDLAWEQGVAGELTLRFSLPAGSYATAVVRELIGDDPANPAIEKRVEIEG